MATANMPTPSRRRPTAVIDVADPAMRSGDHEAARRSGRERDHGRAPSPATIPRNCASAHRPHADRRRTLHRAFPRLRRRLEADQRRRDASRKHGGGRSVSAGRGRPIPRIFYDPSGHARSAARSTRTLTGRFEAARAPSPLRPALRETTQGASREPCPMPRRRRAGLRQPTPKSAIVPRGCRRRKPLFQAMFTGSRAARRDGANGEQPVDAATGPSRRKRKSLTLNLFTDRDGAAAQAAGGKSERSRGLIVVNDAESSYGERFVKPRPLGFLDAVDV